MLLASTIVLASIYALLGAGFVIVYKTSRILNFAHAQVVMLAGYFAVTVAALTLGNLTIILAVLCFCFFLGMIVYAILIRPLVGYSVLSAIILTVAVGVVLNAATVFVWRGEMEVIPFGWRAYYTLPGDIRLSSIEIATLGMVALFFTGMGLFYHFSRIGQQMRATAENPLLAAQRGISIYGISGIAWGIGFAAAGLAAILLGINYTVSLQMGNIAVAAFVVALVGGLDSLWGTIPAAFIIAATEQLTITYVNPRLAEAIPFIILLIVLMFKPWGFWGTKEELERV
jgi:branched-chain amino acid transport system permease protein